MKDCTKTKGWIEGLKASQYTQKQNRLARIDVYNDNPNKCEYCGMLFEDVSKYQAHIADEERKQAFLAKYPAVEDSGCDFSNGGWNVQRSKEWLESYKKDIAKLVNSTSYEAFSYGWFRVLDDGGSMFYGLACRVLDVCPDCFREWGQGYYASHCDHRDKIQSKNGR